MVGGGGEAAVGMQGGSRRGERDDCIEQRAGLGLDGPLQFREFFLRGMAAAEEERSGIGR